MADGNISGTPISDGVISFIAEVSDEVGGTAEKQFDLTISPAFICGDINADTEINLSDILGLISFVYGDPPGSAPDPWQSGDVNNGDGNINLTDILYLIEYVYGTPPGPDPVCE